MLIKQRKYLCIGILIAIAILGLVIWSYAPPYGEICNKNEYTSTKDCANYHMILVVLWQIGKFLDHWGIALTAIFTFLVAIFTGFLFLDAREKGRKELRAYLGVKTQTIRLIGPNNFQAVVTIQNTGKTPARDVRRFIDVGVGPEDGPDNGFTEPKMIQKMPLAPTAKWKIRLRFRLEKHITVEEIPLIAMEGSNRYAFVWGRIEYRDIYEDPQWVNFRFITREVRTIATTTESIDESGKPHAVTVITGTGWALHPTEDGNDAS